MSATALRMIDINKSFDGVKVLKDVCFEVKAGEIHALLGENGAGKSVLMKTLMGVHQPDSGEYVVGGKHVQFANPTEAQENGVSMVYQEFGLVKSLSVTENIFLGKMPSNRGVIQWNKAREEAAAVLKRLGSDISPYAMVEKLKVSEQQEVEIARALSYDPVVFIMDEPSAALSHAEIEHLYKLVNILRARDVAIVYITHKLNEVFEIADRVTVIRDGNIVGSYDINELDITELVEKMTGKHVSAEIIRTGVYQAPSENVLELQNVSAEGLFHDINLKVGKGEIVGIAGLIGAGKSEIGRAIFGALPRKHRVSGLMRFDGQEVDIRSLSPRKCKSMGIALVPEDRHEDGVIADQTVFFNMILSAFHYISKGSVIADWTARNLVWLTIRDVALHPPEPNRMVRLLSGGNQQKVVIGKWLAADPRLIILDEPTRGVDVGAREEIYEVVRGNARKKGLGVLLLSSDLREIMLASDRILVMSLGRITHQLLPSETSDKQLLSIVIGEQGGANNG